MNRCEAMEINYNVSGEIVYFPGIVSSTAGTVGLVAGNVLICGRHDIEYPNISVGAF